MVIDRKEHDAALNALGQITATTRAMREYAHALNGEYASDADREVARVIRGFATDILVESSNALMAVTRWREE